MIARVWRGIIRANPLKYGSIAAAEGDIGGGVAPPMEVPGGPSIAMFNDPDGNLIGLMKRS
jgi:predicted enzyme related to lactoylglutathione lyase